MNASYAYALGYTGRGVKLGAVDSGVYADHPEFKGGRIHPVDIAGTYSSDGYRYEQRSLDSDSTDRGWQVTADPVPESRFTAGTRFSTPGRYDGRINDPHGTHVSGTIAANRDGTGMHGVAFDADLFVANSGGTDASLYGSMADYAYFLEAYGRVAAAGARAINTSWGSAPAADDYATLAGLTKAYQGFFGHKTHLDAMAEVSQRTGTLQVIAAGNDGTPNPDLRNALPYFRPEVEPFWITVGASRRAGNGRPTDVEIASFSDRAGIAKYWTVFAPGEAIISTVPPARDGDAWEDERSGWGITAPDQAYTTVSGTSMAAPHATGALGVVMQRYAYLDNQGARTVLLTTAQHRDAVQGTPDDTTELARDDAPNAVWGWGAIDLRAAMNGPGQFLGAFTATLGKGVSDTWYNTITEDALIQRKREDAAEQAAWRQTLVQKGWDKAPPGAAASLDDRVAYAVGTARAEAAASRIYQGSLVKGGEGSLTLAGADSTYSGGTLLNGGTLELAARGAAGTGAISFGRGAQTLKVDQAALGAGAGHDLGNLLAGFAADGDVIDVCGIGSNAVARFDYPSDTLRLTDAAGGTCYATLHLTGDFGGKRFTASSDGAGGTKVALSVPVATVRTRAPGEGAAWDELARTWDSAEYQADWGLAAMHADAAYALGYTGRGVKLGEVDSGIYADHPEFKGGRIHPVEVKGTYRDDGYFYENAYWIWNGGWRQVSGGPVESSVYKAGQPFDTPGTYDGKINDPHGTHVGGSIAASRDGTGMHGVAFDADLYVANTGSTDGTVCGPNRDYAYFKAAYGNLAAAGARVINSSWGQEGPGTDFSTLSGLMAAYTAYAAKPSWLDAMEEVVQQYGEIHTWWAGNDSGTSPIVPASLPYFRPEIERNWVAVGAQGSQDSPPDPDQPAWFSNLAGVAKYWTVFAPGNAIISTVPPARDGDAWEDERSAWHVTAPDQAYTTVGGTSMSTPHATGALGVVMQRYAYLDNQGARDVLLTTARHLDAVRGTPDDTTGLARDDAPNAVWGWGAIDLRAAMNGPGQFLGAFTATLGKGGSDTWYNTVTEDALIQRKREDAAEQAAWRATLAQKGWDKAPPGATASLDDRVAYAVGTARAEAAASRVYQGSLVKGGEGSLTLAGADSTYSGGTLLNGGTLELAARGAAGTGAISFGRGAQTLRIDREALGASGGHALANTLAGFGGDGDVIDVCGIGSNAVALFDYHTDTLRLIDPTSATCGATLHFTGDYTGTAFITGSDGSGGTTVSLIDPMARSWGRPAWCPAGHGIDPHAADLLLGGETWDGLPGVHDGAVPGWDEEGAGLLADWAAPAHHGRGFSGPVAGLPWSGL
ncbi:S8 family serine peptidase [Methylobacterium sp. JK268]